MRTRIIFSIKFHKFIHSDFKTNEAKRELLSVNVLCYALIRGGPQSISEQLSVLSDN